MLAGVLAHVHLRHANGVALVKVRFELLQRGLLHVGIGYERVRVVCSRWGEELACGALGSADTAFEAGGARRRWGL